jgi:phosphoribosylglycinamide formyltransferase 2
MVLLLGNSFLGNPPQADNVRVLLLGSGELGKEVAIEFMRLGAWVCAADAYPHAPASYVADEARVTDMADAERLAALIAQVQPTIIVPEIEAIATQVLADAAASGILVAASSQAIEICMDRERLRTLAAADLGLPTTPYRLAGNLDEMKEAVAAVGAPCVVKPVMSSSGHGQSIIRCDDPVVIADAWEIAQNERRAAEESDVSRVIVEAFAPIEYELTLLTVSSAAGVTCCRPIGQRQEDGDYRESWQPAAVPAETLQEARRIATTCVHGLAQKASENGEECRGVFGVELFVLTDGRVLFNEVSPRPHDTGMVTMISQNLSEFALHARALLGVPLDAEALALRTQDGTVWASRPLVASGYGTPRISGIAQALSVPSADVRLFGKPVISGHRRLAVALASGKSEAEARKRTQEIVNALETNLS